ncbi:ABC-type multidrug transport system ATPase subunit [Staphylococcus hominis]
MLVYQSGVLQKNNIDKENSIGALIETPGIYPFLTGYENIKLFDETNNGSNIKK